MPSQSGQSAPQWSPKDQAYMKEYLESHPDNRMAWYLLGKQYERSGEQGKANYCFNQAGDIYKAFENEPLPQETVEEQMKERTEREKRRRTKAAQLRAGLLAILFLLLLVLLPGGEAAAPDGMRLHVQRDKGHAPGPQEEIAGGTFYRLVAAGDDEGYAHVLRRILEKDRKRAGEDVVVRMESDEAWLIWSRTPEPVLLASTPSEGGPIEMLPLAEPDCRCEEERQAASQGAALWAEASERRLIAKSALTAYVKQGKTAPDQWPAMAKAYPANSVSGTSAGTEQAYAEVLQVYRNGMARGAKRKRTEQALSRMWADEADPFREPLRIVVDKKRHRLGVVSGGILLRNYEVGLGGSRTPKGKFVISEKVVNPNGSSTGVFGSRGMTLSDTLYAIHGTNEPASIGRDESLGCIRMLPDDVEELFDMVPIGTEVSIESDVLPGDLQVPNPEDRYRLDLTPKQDNPGKVYRWLD
ncbi:L,D-transpeptidase [Paenibacillus thiaminolyticus]|uniref:L,D-transpeptidase n=1 Tax=Paenibacillus thiaminolyticus TaxID=49283 RepID=UPI001161FCF8|nr:L,D-transpeptidase [Paenibacillus thiaminolyticus]NGP57460.1 L,D-transpeptidase [Paenibacillus thiaminolyticus]WCR27343.1 L,D-transpeptidase [Paenibacillus thiaminolyticus]